MTYPKKVLSNDEEISLRLIKKLRPFYQPNSVVVGIGSVSRGIALALAKDLCLPLKFIPCQPIINPSNVKRYIGSVSPRQVVLHDVAYDIPQDYLIHQVHKLKESLTQDCPESFQDVPPDFWLYKGTCSK